MLGNVCWRVKLEDVFSSKSSEANLRTVSARRVGLKMWGVYFWALTSASVER